MSCAPFTIDDLLSTQFLFFEIDPGWFFCA